MAPIPTQIPLESSSRPSNSTRPPAPSRAGSRLPGAKYPAAYFAAGSCMGPSVYAIGASKCEGCIVMGSHRSMRAGSGHRRGWRSGVIVGVGMGFAVATVAGVGMASGTTGPTPSVYSAITPVTVLGRSLAADSNTDVTVAGVDSVPSNATSVQLSVTALSGTTTSSMYVYPTGATKPASPNVPRETGQTITIPVTVALGTGGKIRLTTDGGTVTIKVAVVGYFSPAPAPGSAGYAASVLTEQIADGANGGTTIASITVPAGLYEVHATASMSLDD